VALDFGEMQRIETSSWPEGRQPMVSIFLRGSGYSGSPAFFKSLINQGGRGRLFFC
jgi:hypothetical protein